MGIVIFSVIKLRLSHYLLLHLTLLVAELGYQPPLRASLLFCCRDTAFVTPVNLLDHEPHDNCH